MSALRPRLTCAVLARDVADVLDDCLTSVSFADEVVVLVDAATSDATREIARRHGVRVEERVFDSFASQRDAALDLARGDWVLFVDADERVTPALCAEVAQVLDDPRGRRGFWIPRDNVLLGRVVRHAGWWPDYQLRLVQRGAAHYDPRRLVHELPIVDGTVGHLQHPFVHLNYRSVREFVFKQERYCRLDARRWLLTYGRPRARAVLGQPLREFWRRYITLQGFKEGPLGLMLCLLLAYYAGKAVWLARSADSRAQLGDGGELAHANQKLG